MDDGRQFQGHVRQFEVGALPTKSRCGLGLAPRRRQNIESFRHNIPLPHATHFVFLPRHCYPARVARHGFINTLKWQQRSKCAARRRRVRDALATHRHLLPATRQPLPDSSTACMGTQTAQSFLATEDARWQGVEARRAGGDPQEEECWRCWRQDGQEDAVG